MVKTGAAVSVKSAGMDSPTLVAPLPSTRSRIANGSARLTGVDHRSAQARRFRDLVIDLAGDLGIKPDELSEADRATIRNAAGLILQSEQVQAAIVRGESVDADAAIRLASTAQRLMATLRKRRVVVARAPNLSDYLRERAARVAGDSGAAPGAERPGTEHALSDSANASTAA